MDFDIFVLKVFLFQRRMKGTLNFEDGELVWDEFEDNQDTGIVCKSRRSY